MQAVFIFEKPRKNESLDSSGVVFFCQNGTPVRAGLFGHAIEKKRS
jgi:hypothetical protein